MVAFKHLLAQVEEVPVHRFGLLPLALLARDPGKLVLGLQGLTVILAENAPPVPQDVPEGGQSLAEAALPGDREGQLVAGRQGCRRVAPQVDQAVAKSIPVALLGLRPPALAGGDPPELVAAGEGVRVGVAEHAQPDVEDVLVDGLRLGRIPPVGDCPGEMVPGAQHRWMFLAQRRTARQGGPAQGAGSLPGAAVAEGTGRISRGIHEHGEVLPIHVFASGVEHSQQVLTEQPVPGPVIRHVDAELPQRADERFGRGDELIVTAIGEAGPVEVARHQRTRPGSPAINDDHYPPSARGERTPKATSAAEAAFLALGPGAAAWLMEAAAAGTRRIRHKMTEAVAFAKLHGAAEVDRALGTAAIAGRFAEDDLISILDHQSAGGEACQPARPSEHHSLQPGTAAWSTFGINTDGGEEVASR